jgi:hypothetical protein
LKNVYQVEIRISANVKGPLPARQESRRWFYDSMRSKADILCEGPEIVDGTHEWDSDA